MRVSPTPDNWLDRGQIKFGLDKARKWNPSAMSDEEIVGALRRLQVVGMDPGGTTGWCVLTVDYHKLVDQTVLVHQAVTDWKHGQIDCGTSSGNAGDSATANELDLGISETGEAAGVWLLENIVTSANLWPGSTVVVIEDFILRTNNKSRDALSPVRITAALQQLLWECQSVEVVKQQPAEAKTSLTDERLKKKGFYTGSNSDRHARDADRHALLFLQKCRQKSSKMKQAFPLITEAAKRSLV